MIKKKESETTGTWSMSDDNELSHAVKLVQNELIDVVRSYRTRECHNFSVLQTVKTSDLDRRTVCTCEDTSDLSYYLSS